MAHGKSCYYVANTSSASTWNKSRIFCQNLGADLAVIKSKEENQFVYDLLRNTSVKNNGWIGLHRKADDENFSWLDSRPEKGNFQNWGSRKRSESPSDENCVLIIRVNPAGKWNDKECSHTSPVAICQWPI